MAVEDTNVGNWIYYVIPRYFRSYFETHFLFFVLGAFYLSFE